MYLFRMLTTIYTYFYAVSSHATKVLHRNVKILERLTFPVKFLMKMIFYAGMCTF